jgi:hypothetical protein
MEYYRGVGVEFFVFYIHGMLAEFPNVRALAKLLGVRGVPVVFTEWNIHPYFVESKLLKHAVHNVQVSAMNSVLYRMKGWTKWLGFLDLDEYINLPVQYSNLREKLESVENNVSTVIFSNSFAYLNRTDQSKVSFSLDEFFSSSIIYEIDIGSRNPSKYFTRVSETHDVTVHVPGSVDGIAEWNKLSNYYFHFSFEHPGRSKKEILRPGVIDPNMIFKDISRRSRRN